jgi:hypothetical protein
MNSLTDAVGGANLFGGLSYSFVPDRFCSLNSAIYFNRGYLQVPTGVYFSGDFTLTALIYLKSFQSYSRIIDFGNGQENENVLLGLAGRTSQIIGFSYNSSSKTYIEASSIIKLNQWYFISFVLSGTTGYIYVNGSQVATKLLLIVPNNITRTSNYIGKSNFENISNADAIYDEIKIYNRALTSIEISSQYSVSLNYGK